jgi:hypothetical protein
MKGEFGIDMAKQIIHWRLSHMQELQRVASEEGISERCQIRQVACADVYYAREDFEAAKRNLAAWKQDMPDQAADVHSLEADEAMSVSLPTFSASVETPTFH